jgi:hypothetical protein
MLLFKELFDFISGLSKAVWNYFLLGLAYTGIAVTVVTVVGC